MDFGRDTMILGLGKLDCENKDDLVDFLQRIRKAYVEGLCWVLVYYYQARLVFTTCRNESQSLTPGKGLPFLDLVLSISLCASDTVYNLL